MRNTVIPRQNRANLRQATKKRPSGAIFVERRLQQCYTLPLGVGVETAERVADLGSPKITVSPVESPDRPRLTDVRSEWAAARGATDCWSLLAVYARQSAVALLEPESTSRPPGLEMFRKIAPI